MSVAVPDVPLTGWGTPEDWQQLLPLNVHSNAYEASRVIKTGPGLLYGFEIYNSKGTAQFVQVFDAATLPADGAIPACIFTAAATANLPVQWIPPRAFYVGCVICNSSTGPTKTIGSADLFMDVQFL